MTPRKRAFRDVSGMGGWQTITPSLLPPFTLSFVPLSLRPIVAVLVRARRVDKRCSCVGSPHLPDRIGGPRSSLGELLQSKTDRVLSDSTPMHESRAIPDTFLPA